MYILIFFVTAVISEKQQCCFGEYMGDWSDCDKSCGGGERLRQKELLTAADSFWSAAGAWITGSCPEYEAPCSDHQYDKQDCNNIPCREYDPFFMGSYYNNLSISTLDNITYIV